METPTNPGRFKVTSPRGRFLRLRLAARNVIVCLSSGVTNGPHPLHLRLLDELVQDPNARPAGIFASRVDRYARSREAMARFYESMAHVNESKRLWIGDGSVGRWMLDEPWMGECLPELSEALGREAYARKIGVHPSSLIHREA